MPVLEQVRRDKHFSPAEFATRNGIVVFRVDSEPDVPAPAPVRSDPAAPPELAHARIVEGGKSALDSLNGSLRGPDGSFVVAKTGALSCDGWAFEDVNRSAPEKVWIALTDTATGTRHYWHAKRYSRPALAEALKIPSVTKAGFTCDQAGYSIPAGTYSAQIYQLDGKTAVMSDFTTYTAAPRIVVR